MKIGQNQLERVFDADALGGRAGDDVTKALLPLLQDPNYKVRWAAANSLSSLMPIPRMGDRLADLLEAGNPRQHQLIYDVLHPIAWSMTDVVQTDRRRILVVLGELTDSVSPTTMRDLTGAG